MILLEVCWLIIFITSCQENDALILSSSNKVLNQHLSASPYTVIDLESIEIDSVLIKTEDVLGRTTTLDSSAVIGLAAGLVKVDGHLYVADEQQNTIWQLDLEGNLIGNIGRQGNGPGEFQRLSGLVSNNTYVFAFDEMSRSVSVFDTQLRFLRSINLRGGFTHLSSEKVAVNNELLFLPLSLIAPPDSERHLLQSYKASPPFEESDAILSPLVPGAGTMNNYLISSNHLNENLLLGFKKLNYIFVFDKELNQTHTIILNSAHDQFPDRVEEIEPMTVPNFLTGFYLSDDGTIFVSTAVSSEGRDTRYVLYRISKESNSYRLSHGYQFVYEDLIVDRPTLPPVEMFVEEDTLYFIPSLSEYVYRYPF